MPKTGLNTNNISGTSLRCTLCGRPLAVAFDPLSGDCGGDCWGCIGLVEADMGGDVGWVSSTKAVREEIARGWREADGSPKPQTYFSESGSTHTFGTSTG